MTFKGKLLTAILTVLIVATASYGIVGVLDKNDQTMEGAWTFKKMTYLDGGVEYEVVPKTASYTIFASEAGATFTNASATGEITYTMPEASTIIGQPFWFYVSAAHTMNVDVDAADQILPTCNAAGDKLQNTGTAGNNVCLMAVDSTYFAIRGKEQGTWSDAN